MPAADPQISLDQWRAFLAVVDCCGYAQAAAKLHKSQSAITYAVQKIEAILRVKLFEIQGRKAVLTEAGVLLARRARTLIDEAAQVEAGARFITEEWLPEIRLSVNVLFPQAALFSALSAFALVRSETRIEVFETVLSSEDALVEGTADLALSSQVPQGYLGSHLLQVRLIAAAHPRHPLHQLKRKITLRDLRRYRQLVVRDTGAGRKRSGGWLGAEQRLTVSNLATSIRAACAGLGYAWYPHEEIQREIEAGLLKPLPLGKGSERTVDLYLVYRDGDFVPRDVTRLANLLRTHATR